MITQQIRRNPTSIMATCILFTAIVPVLVNLKASNDATKKLQIKLGSSLRDIVPEGISQGFQLQHVDKNTRKTDKEQQSVEKSNPIKRNKISILNTTYKCQGTSNKTHVLPIAPHFIIAGAQKGGTSALSKIFTLIPRLFKNKHFEAHFFEHLWRYGPLQRLSDEQRSCDILVRYIEKEFNTKTLLAGNGSLLSYEKTPDYLPCPHVPSRLVKILPWKPKIIIMLRDPVRRFHSFYNMRPGSFSSLEDFLKSEVDKLRKQQFIAAPPFDSPVWMNGSDTLFETKDMVIRESLVQRSVIWRSELYYGMYAQQIRNWLQHFPLKTSMKVICYEEFNLNRAAQLEEILEFLGLPGHNISEAELSSDLSHNAADKGASYYKPLQQQTQEYLRRFYKPYNDELADLLGERWRTVWGY